MGLFARKMEKYAGGKEKKKERAVWKWDYESFVNMSRRVVVWLTRAQQREAIREVLLSMLPHRALPANTLGLQ
ncbi:hypothetical protein E2562_035187 [Oryza meyeriana var. granulata]|uniref:Uncharacterized protein n=1 Tax=Oryza meyeriana var. granulata TaxID=110450 RepID=A0A6G1DC77_9ORYZ|nr:hypothetical protein E2562_035187 [Oryza meyeriana var. granulata]